MKIPIITVNSGYTKATSFQATMTTDYCLPCSYHTSSVIKDKTNQVHVIPVEDNVTIIDIIPNAESNRVEIDN